MELYTTVRIPEPPFRLGLGERILLLGSCFAENIGAKLEEGKMNVDVNPFGTLYNPSSIATALRILLHPERFTENNLFHHEGIYHSFAHHSRFSSISKEECLDNINDRLFASAEKIRETKCLMITLGTAYVYRLKSTGEVVANCHKLPEDMFTREMLGVDEVVKEWKELLLSIWEQCPELKVLFTVSPIRHLRDGAHANQLSKATLLLFAEALRRSFPERVTYFPAYEIIMDELRDYRFYADDMLHPSPLAVDYLWQRFTEVFLSAEAGEALKEWTGVRRALEHRPFNPEGEEYKRFLSQTLLKMKRFSEKFPSFDCSKEMETIESKLK